MRSVTSAASAVAAATAMTVLAIALMPRIAPPEMGFGMFDASDQEPQAAARPVMSSVTPSRLSAVIGRPYGLRFATDADSDRVEVSSASLPAGERLDVVLFGGLPGSVRGMACEASRADVTGAGALLGECARVAAGDAGAPVVAAWIRTELGGPVGGGVWSASAVVGATHYALRAVPADRSWVLSMSPDGT